MVCLFDNPKWKITWNLNVLIWIIVGLFVKCMRAYYTFINRLIELLTFGDSKWNAFEALCKAVFQHYTLYIMCSRNIAHSKLLNFESGMA